MDSATLVDNRLEDGRKLIDVLTLKGVDVTAAAWVKTSEEGIWFLYICTEAVDKGGLARAYHDVYGALRELPDVSISSSDIKLVGKMNPITKDILAIQGIRSSSSPVHYQVPFLGKVGVEEVYAYPPYVSLRQSFFVSYIRQGETNTWNAKTARGELLRGTKAKGAIGYTTARWEGEKSGTENHGSIGVLLEIGPQFDDPQVLNDSNVQLLMKREANQIADEMFKHHHPDAVIVHVDDEYAREAEQQRRMRNEARHRPFTPFIGGPYDRMEIELKHINKFSHIVPVTTKRGIRLFILMPPRKDWDRLVSGQTIKDAQFEMLFAYERIFLPGGVEFRYCENEEITRALADQG